MPFFITITRTVRGREVTEQVVTDNLLWMEVESNGNRVRVNTDRTGKIHISAVDGSLLIEPRASNSMVVEVVR